MVGVRDELLCELLSEPQGCVNASLYRCELIGSRAGENVSTVVQLQRGTILNALLLVSVLYIAKDFLCPHAFRILSIPVAM